jgi:protein kinase C substrate 80K-H
VTAAREAHQAVEKDLNDKKSQAGGLTGDLEKDYGPDDVFLALKDKCVSQDSGEYTYELCWLTKTTQKSKKGGGQTGLGDFVRFETVVVDEEVGADGKGLGSGERIALKYENGQHCWNGPHRSTMVVVACAEKDEIWKVAEMEKCVYRMEVGSPAACEPRRDGPKGKDEL